MNNTKNIKVCHITTVHPAKDVRILIKECASLSKAGFDVTLIVVGEESEFIFDGVKVIGLDKKYRTRFSRLINAPGLAYCEAIKIKAEIYHFHDPEFLRYAKKLARKKKIVIYDVHEDLPRQILAKYYIPK
ncbi:MAG: hypothetical protein RQ866_06710, partial [Bacteroidales bacterium]|nr:hypothetical protein [Bacteroidales bacterium]